VFTINPRLKKFKILTTWVEENKVENLLEATLYLNEAFRFIDLLMFLDKNSISYKVFEGFKGRTCFKENGNKFRDIVLDVSETEIGNVIEFFNNSKKCNEIFKTSVIDERHIKVEIR